MNDSRLHFENDDELENFNNIQRDYDYVSFVLKKADEYGLKLEVEEAAKEYLKANKDLKLSDAYYHAYHDWVK